MVWKVPIHIIRTAHTRQMATITSFNKWRRAIEWNKIDDLFTTTVVDITVSLLCCTHNNVLLLQYCIWVKSASKNLLLFYPSCQWNTAVFNRSTMFADYYLPSRIDGASSHEWNTCWGRRHDYDGLISAVVYTERNTELSTSLSSSSSPLNRYDSDDAAVLIQCIRDDDIVNKI